MLRGMQSFEVWLDTNGKISLTHYRAAEPPEKLSLIQIDGHLWARVTEIGKTTAGHPLIHATALDAA
jgi:hypothetical protein